MEWPYPERDDQIQPEQARYLYERHCALLVLEGLPPGSEFGIDLASFRVGDKFRGLKLIPPGVHFVFASASDKQQQLGPRCGFYHDFQPRELLVKRWSVEEEDFDNSRSVGDEERERYSANLRDLDRYLGAYRFSTYSAYLKLTTKMSARLVEDLVPTNKRIRSVTYLTRGTRSDTTQEQPMRRRGRFSKPNRESDHPSEESLMPHLNQPEESRIKFIRLSDPPEPQKQMTPDALTKYHLDSSVRLEQAIEILGGEHERLLGELQFAFVTLILGHVYDCFEHWRDLLVLLCSSDSALDKRPHLFLDFTRILHDQLEQVPEELFEDITHTDNLIRHHIDIFLQNVDQSDCILELKDTADKLRHLAETKFGWIFELERDDELPVIVEM